MQQNVQLSHLMLRDLYHMSQLPAALTGLSRLQSLCWTGPQLEHSSLLLAGPWLGHLCWLELPAALVAGRMHLLSAAERLECLGLIEFDQPDTSGQVGMLRWAACHPLLHRLCLGFPSNAPLPAKTAEAILQAQCQKPSLCVELNGLLSMSCKGCAMCCVTHFSISVCD